MTIPSLRWSAGLLLTLLAAVANAGSPSLETAPAELRLLPREFQLDGLVEAVQRTTVSAQTSGQVEAVLFDVDDYVEKDQVILTLQDTEQRTRMDRAEADLAEARARVEEARDEFRRAEGLFAKQLISESAMDKAEAALKSARAREQAAQAGLAEAAQQFAYTRVRAPYSGIVTERHVEPGTIAQPGQPLMSGISLERLRVSVDLPQSLVPRIRETGQARVRLADGSWVSAGEITVFPYADPAAASFRVRLELPPEAQGLFPGMYVKTAFVIGDEQQLVVPSRTLVYRSEVTGVYVVAADGALSFRHIRPGRRLDGDLIQVLAGLEAGERLALDPIAAGVLLKQQREGGGNE